MRAKYSVCLMVTALFLSGCDPGGLRRIELRLRSPGSECSAISVDSPDTQGAFQLLDTVLFKQGFHLGKSEPGYVRAYELPRSPTIYQGQTIPRKSVPCRVKLTATGIFVTFGGAGLLGGQPEAEDAYNSVRRAFLRKYGRKNVRGHKLGFPKEGT